MLGDTLPESVEAMERQASALRELGARAVFLKGGRRENASSATDVLCTADGIERFETPRVAIERPHGTGCTLSSAIAARLAMGSSLREAVVAGKRYVTASLQRAVHTPVGHGARPLIHAETNTTNF